VAEEALASSALSDRSSAADWPLARRWGCQARRLFYLFDLSDLEQSCKFYLIADRPLIGGLGGGGVTCPPMGGPVGHVQELGVGFL